jgi:hypothetical protein
VANAKRDRLRATGAQALRLFGGGVLSVELEASALAAVSRALRGAVDGLADVMFENTANAHSVAAFELQWPWLYHTLVALERFVTAPRDALRAAARRRRAARRVVAGERVPALSARVGASRRVPRGRLLLCALRAQRRRLCVAPADVLRVVDALCAQLDSPHLTDEHGEQVVKNLLVLMRHALALGDARSMRASVCRRGDGAHRQRAPARAGDERRCRQGGSFV